MSGRPAVSIVVEQLRRSVSGGIGTYARGLLSGLAELGEARPEIELVASRARERPDPLAALGFGLATSRLPGPLLTRLWDAGWPLPATGAVTHATSLAYPRPRARLAVMVHDLAFREAPETFPARGRAWHERRLAAAVAGADALVVPSERTAAQLVAAGASGPVVHVIEEGADHLPRPDLAGADALLRQLGVDGPFVLTVGTLEPRKNLPRLFDAYRAMRAGPHGRAGAPMLVVVGPTGWGDAVADPPEGVVLAGKVDDGVLAALYAHALAFVYVPLLEGFGLPPVEAMIAGAPVIASDTVPSVAAAALLVSPVDTPALADALAAVITDPGLRADLSARGRARAAELTWRRAAEAHVALWESLS